MTVVTVLSFLIVIVIAGFKLLQSKQTILGLLAIILGFFWFFALFTLSVYIWAFRGRIREHNKIQYFISLIAGVYGGLIVLAGDRLLSSQDLFGSILSGSVFFALAIIFTVMGLIALATVDGSNTSEEN